VPAKIPLQPTTPQIALIGMWLLAFAFSACTGLYFWEDIPEGRQVFMNQIVDSFAPGLTVMLAALFTKNQRNSAAATPGGPLTVTDVIAFAVALFYLFGFALTVFRFILDKTTISAANEIFASWRTFTGWLVLPILTYYFGRSPAPAAAPKPPQPRSRS
jgi:hypothetical protein